MTQEEFVYQVRTMTDKILIVYPDVMYVIMLALCFIMMISLIIYVIICRFRRWRKKRNMV